jgi:hypothetical protein
LWQLNAFTTFWAAPWPLKYQCEWKAHNPPLPATLPTPKILPIVTISSANVANVVNALAGEEGFRDIDEILNAAIVNC